jgi:hypothetical protein
MVELLEAPVDQPAPACPYADDLVAAVERAAPDRPDDGVQPGAVAPAGEERDAFTHAF